MIADLPAIVYQAPISFAVGVIVGFLLADRFRIVRRNGKERE